MDKAACEFAKTTIMNSLRFLCKRAATPTAKTELGLNRIEELVDQLIAAGTPVMTSKD